MKKLMIVAAAVLGAVIAHGASVAWTITNVNGPTGSALGAGKAYMFFVEGNSKADTSAWVALENGGVDAFVAAVAAANFSYTHDDIGSAADGTWTYNATTIAGTESTLKSNGDLGLTGSTKYSVYAIITDTESITDSTQFMVTTATAASTTLNDSSGSTKTYAIGTQATASGTWYTVAPEPTSGLLMLLGMAGLALRRKRA